MVILMLSSVIFATLFSLVIGTTEYYGLDEGKAVSPAVFIPFPSNAWDFMCDGGACVFVCFCFACLCFFWLNLYILIYWCFKQKSMFFLDLPTYMLRFDWHIQVPLKVLQTGFDTFTYKWLVQ